MRKMERGKMKWTARRNHEHTLLGAPGTKCCVELQYVCVCVWEQRSVCPWYRIVLDEQSD